MTCLKDATVVCLCESSFKQLKQNIQNANVHTASTTQLIANNDIAALTTFKHDAMRKKKMCHALQLLFEVHDLLLIDVLL